MCRRRLLTVNLAAAVVEAVLGVHGAAVVDDDDVVRRGGESAPLGRDGASVERQDVISCRIVSSGYTRRPGEAPALLAAAPGFGATFSPCLIAAGARRWMPRSARRSRPCAWDTRGARTHGGTGRAARPTPRATTVRGGGRGAAAAAAPAAPRPVRRAAA